MTRENTEMNTPIHPMCRSDPVRNGGDSTNDNSIVWEDSMMLSFGSWYKTRTPVTVYVESFDAEVCHTNPYCEEIDGESLAYAKRERMADCPDCEDWP